ncbi:helix-turn-helix domain-containing protein [Caulobacter rhizosphaerae]|nr:MerR family transcriptional regulator [Caulobacter rhizosphaerae]
MFERADRRMGLAGGVCASPPRRVRRGVLSHSAAERALAEIGLSRARLRQWEEFGVIELRRSPGRHRIVDGRVLDHLRLILALRTAGYSLRDITYLSLDGPPTVEILRRRVAQVEAERALTLPLRLGASALRPRRESLAAAA